MHRIFSILLLLGLTAGWALADTTVAPQELLTTQNPLMKRYFMLVPQVVHVVVGEPQKEFTLTRTSDGALHLNPGLEGSPFLTLKPAAGDIQTLTTAVADGWLSMPEKLEVAASFAAFGEKPFQPPPVSEVACPEADYLASFEARLLKVSSMAKRLRWLFNKTMTAPNQIVKLFYGLQIRVWTAISERTSSKLLQQVADEVRDDVERGQVEVARKSLLDQLVSVLAMHLMAKSEDTPAYNAILKGLLKHLQSVATVHAAEGRRTGNPQEALKVRLDAVRKLIELVQNNG
ncbi:MAG: hypothetical protein HY814_13265 [Candidatus Riflebacteria bacterium]|nr:hypothetical protein [Candidatus Riflebacteria bacterium]